ncbi:MAG TPA: glycosyltransferase [Rhodanobacteraceae bacterium]|nr:glycosyltransferase [Rhodanobacteraceae bacterium]
MKPLLAVLGWYRPGTGFTRVLDKLTRGLAARYRVRWYGVGHHGDPLELADGIEIVPTNLRGGDVLGAYALARELPALRPRAIFALNDIWHLAHYARVLAPVRARARLVGYFPLDGRPLTADIVAPLEGFDALATYTRAARDAFRAAWPRTLDRPILRVVAHGVDGVAFRPSRALRDADFAPVARLSARRTAFPAWPADESAFVVLNASRPDPRKRLDLTLEGFARFASGKPPGVRLCLHHAVHIPDVARGLHERAAGLGLSERLLFDDASGTLSDASLNTLYNACDVGLNTSAGEGFGLVSFEHAAAGAAQIVPDHEALAELWGPHALRAPLARRYVPDFSPLEMGETSPAAVADALEGLYRDRDRLRACSRAACAHARRPRWRWRRIVEGIGRLIEAAA